MTEFHGWRRAMDYRLYVAVCAAFIAGAFLIHAINAQHITQQRFKRIEQLDQGQRELRRNNTMLIEMAEDRGAENAKLLAEVQALREEVTRLGGNPDRAIASGTTTTTTTSRRTAAGTTQRPENRPTESPQSPANDSPGPTTPQRSEPSPAPPPSTTTTTQPRLICVPPVCI